MDIIIYKPEDILKLQNSVIEDNIEKVLNDIYEKYLKPKGIIIKQNDNIKEDDLIKKNITSQLNKLTDSNFEIISKKMLNDFNFIDHHMLIYFIEN